MLEVLWAQAGHVGSHVSKGGTGVSANQSGVGVVVGFPAALSLQTPCPSAAQEIIIKWMWTWEEMLDAFEQEGTARALLRKSRSFFILRVQQTP
jgi:hypothetical protein